MENKAAHPTPDGAIEIHSLSVGKWVNLIMGVSGITAAVLSRSDALLVDGLFSAVNFISAIVAARVGLSIARRPSRTHPFGYDADEALYVTFRSMTLAGIIAFAAFSASNKILAYLSGEAVPELRFGVIVFYTIAMVALCSGLALWHRHNWKRTGKRSEILKTESRAAFVDGVLSAGAGIALSIVPFLNGTPLAGIVPIADALVVLILAILIIPQPLSQFVGALRELAGENAPQKHYDPVKSAVETLADAEDIDLVDLAFMKLGRSFTLIAYVDPKRPVTAAEMDDLQAKIVDQVRDMFPTLRAEIIVTERSRTQS